MKEKIEYETEVFKIFSRSKVLARFSRLNTSASMLLTKSPFKTTSKLINCHNAIKLNVFFAVFIVAFKDGGGEEEASLIVCHDNNKFIRCKHKKSTAYGVENLWPGISFIRFLLHNNREGKKSLTINWWNCLRLKQPRMMISVTGKLMEMRIKI